MRKLNLPSRQFTYGVTGIGVTLWVGLLYLTLALFGQHQRLPDWMLGIYMISGIPAIYFFHRWCFKTFVAN